MGRSRLQERFQEQEERHPTEVTFLVTGLDNDDEGDDNNTNANSANSASAKNATDRPVLFRHDSEFSVGSNYEYTSPNNLSIWQGAALLTADCLGTGILALPGDIYVLGYGLGLGFLIANLPINLYAGTILSQVAGHVEDRQKVANQIYQESLSEMAISSQDNVTATVDYQAMNADTLNSKLSTFTLQTQHTQLHHDTATFDFIGMTQALFQDKRVTRWVMVRTATSIVLDNAAMNSD